MLVDTGDGRVHVELFGGGSLPLLLLIHGLGGGIASWERVPQSLAAGGRPVAAIDLRGCGTSERGHTPITLERLADDCAAVVRELGHTKAHLVGHSLGGVVAQDLLVRHAVSCGAAVLVSTSSKVGEKAAASWRRLADVVERKGLSDNGAQRSFSDVFAAEHPDVVKRQASIAAATNPAVYAAQARAASSYDYGARLAAVTNPVLIIQGRDDRLTSVGGSVILNRALPNSELLIEPGVGHNAHLELGARFIGLVRDFLSRHDDAARG